VTRLYLLDPEPGLAWYPFGDARPVCELRAGVWLIRERWEAIAQAETEAVFGPPHLAAFTEDGAAAVRARERVEGPAIIGRSEFAPSGTPPQLGDAPLRLVNDGQAVGWWVPEGHAWEGGELDGDAVELEGVLLAGAYDLVTALEHLLPPDAADFTRETNDGVPDACAVIGDPADVIVLGATVEPGTVFDVRAGPVVLEQHSYIMSGSRGEGPLYVGPGSRILGDAVGASVVGPRCKVHGEVSHSVFVGYANKAHYGYLGHSVIGRWVNLGAGTTTSNLKNTYGPVRLSGPDGKRDTGRQFLGTLIGDHAKTAIGIQFDTGTLVGTGANVFGTVRPSKYVRPFAWGDTDQTVAREQFLAVAERVLPRRDVPVTDDVRRMLGEIYDHAVKRE
jgi:UDP-N-acetylglucosamine diphosphorylase/glucosamine-1-phosphate N-acetyltransferase